MKDFLFSLAPCARAWWRWVGIWRGPTLRLLADYRWQSFWSMAFYGTEMPWGFCHHLIFLQVLLTNLCQDSSLDIVLRLQLLEVSYTNMGCSADIIVKLMQWVSYGFIMAGDWVAQFGLEAWPHSGEILWREVCQFSLWSDVGPVIHLLSWIFYPCIREHSVV